ncbi:unnamed protein product [Arctogadus glacialis]
MKPELTKCLRSIYNQEDDDPHDIRRRTKETKGIGETEVEEGKKGKQSGLEKERKKRKEGRREVCSVMCGNGTQQRQALCHTRDNTIGLCLDSKPDTIRVCRMDPCPKGSSDLNKNGNILIQWLSRPNPHFPLQKTSLRKTSVFSCQPGLLSGERSCMPLLCWALPFSLLLCLQGWPRWGP